MALSPLSAASSVLTPFDIESSRFDMSPARLFSADAEKKLEGLSSAELTFRPVARRSWVLAIMAAVDCRLSRFWRTALLKLIAILQNLLVRTQLLRVRSWDPASS